jgi:hypothetical protein
MARALPLTRWRRPDGLSSFVRDMIALRKTLALCHSCEHKMPRNWRAQYDYELITHFHGECGCDYCRQTTSVNLYVAGEGAYWSEMYRSSKHVRETQERDRQRQLADPRTILAH